MWIDVVMLSLLIIGFIRGAMRGIIMALFALAGWIIGLAAALKLSALVAVQLQEYTGASTRWLPLIAFVLVFMVAVLLVRWAGKAVESMFKLVMLGWMNRLGGALLYGGMYLLFCCICLFYAEKMQLINPDTIAASKIYGLTAGTAPAFIEGLGTVIPLLKTTFNDLKDFFERTGPGGSGILQQPV